MPGHCSKQDLLQRRRQTLRRLGALAALALMSPALLGQLQTPLAVAPAEILNSERIEQRFGSYGVEVLESAAQLRVSNLYSADGEQRICRTLAVVRYPAEVDPRLMRAHRAILEGGSIGAVLAANGWRVQKTHLYYGELDSAARSERLMGAIGPAKLAVHVYLLEAEQQGMRIPYAALAEIHHPDYLRLEDLSEIYGAPDEKRAPAAVTELLALAAEKLR